jgi:hypothetical protein
LAWLVLFIDSLVSNIVLALLEPDSDASECPDLLLVSSKVSRVNFHVVVSIDVIHTLAYIESDFI